jgi:hypothetical protein
MQRRSVRITVLTLLLATPPAAAFFLWTIDRRATGNIAAADAVATHVDRMRDAVAAIGASQQGYVAPGQIDEPWLERTTAEIAALRGELTAARPLLQSGDAAVALDALAASLEALEAADARARRNLSLGQEPMAADVVFSDGRNILDGMVAELRAAQRAEQAAARSEVTALGRIRWAVVGLLALAPLAALALTRRVPFVAAPAEAPAAPAAAPDTPVTAVAPTVDLAAAAALCTDLSRVADTAALSPLAERAASLLDASGLTLWMGAGDQLFAVLGHGYTADQLARFGPIARGADNAVAEAWRSGHLSVTPADAQTPGALAAPMFGPNGCAGVLALEIRLGREQDPAVQAVAAMVAAQLATIVAAWPATSAADVPVAEPHARIA